MILVTGATGRVGFHLLEQLSDADVPATAMVRVEARAGDLPSGVQHVVGTLDGPPSADVLRGFDEVFLLSPVLEQQPELEIGFLDALVTAGQRPHVVKLAADGFQDPECEVGFMRNHRLIARHLDGLDLPTTYLAPTLYMENLLHAADILRTEATLPVPAGQGRVGLVAASDVAAVAAHTLTTEGHEDRLYTVTGPESLGMSDVAARISAVFASTVDYEDVPPERFRERLEAHGLDSWYVDSLLALFDWVRQGAEDTVTDEVRKASDDDPRPLDDWLSELRGAFVGRPDEAPVPQL
ncbi:MAG: hypothetical protein JWN35_610 [Frankiales bacterium]|nr:hypothetical protein [Frankiales bacterium]